MKQEIYNRLTKIEEGDEMYGSFSVDWGKINSEQISRLAFDMDISETSLIQCIRELAADKVIIAKRGTRGTIFFQIKKIGWKPVGAQEGALADKQTKVDPLLLRELIFKYKQIRGFNKIDGWNKRHYAKEAVYGNKLISALIENKIYERFDDDWNNLFDELLSFTEWRFKQIGIQEWTLAGVYKSLDAFIQYKI